MKKTVGYLGRTFITFLQTLSSLYYLFRETVVQTIVLLTDSKKRKQARIWSQVDEIGTHSLPLVLTVAALLGIAITVLISFQLKGVGSFSYIPGFVAVAVFREARRAGLTTGYVSNGNATPQVLEYLRPWVDLYKVDLKSFDDRRYHELGGRLAPILDSIARIHSMGFWLEVVTLVVPGFNDSDAELGALAGFLAGISPDIPWHVTAFYPTYKMTGPGATTARMLERAASIGRAAGLRYVYAGNLPGSVGELENTNCPNCRTLLVERSGFEVFQNRLTADGACPDCQSAIPGFWRPGPQRARENFVTIQEQCD